MLFKEGTQLYSYEIIKEAGAQSMYINYMGAIDVPNLSVNPDIMARTIDLLIENPNISRIVFVQQRNYSYQSSQVFLLQEIANLYVFLTKQERVLSPTKLSIANSKYLSERYNDMANLLIELKRDPILCYVDLNRIIRKEKINLENTVEELKLDQSSYIRLLEKFLELLHKLKLINLSKDMISDGSLLKRDIYYKFFRPDVIPNFTFTRLASSLPENSEIIDQYKIGEGYESAVVTILKRKEDSKYYYHVLPPEYSLEEDKQELLNLARNVLMEHQPKAEEFTDPDKTRQVFFNVSRDLLRDLAESKKVKLDFEELNKLANILVRHTIGFGLIEVLLQDANLQDIVLNAPTSVNPIFLRHQVYDECITNITPSKEDVDSWAAKLRMISGRPLDEANPILDSDIGFGNIRARIAVIQEPLSPDGLAYAIRRHREDPWTLPLFIKNRMLNSFTAGLLSFLVDGSRTLLIAGTRSSGKSSLLGSLMLEIMSKYRIIVIEDSVTGDSKIIVKENGQYKNTTIGELIDKEINKNGFLDIDGREKSLNPDEIEIFSVDKEGKVVLTKPSKFIRHRANKQIYEIKTKSGRKIKVTGDHSLFSLDEKNIIKPIKCCELKEGSFIALPSKLPYDNSLKYLDLLNHLDKINKTIFIHGKGIEEYILKNRKELFVLAYSLGYVKPTVQNWTNKKILPVEIFNKLKDKINKENLFIKSLGCSRSISTYFILDKDFLNFVGLWLADGCYDNNSVIVSVQEEENRNVVRNVAEKFGIPVKMHSDKFSLMLNSVLLKEIMQKVLELNGDSYTKKIPDWIFNLDNSGVSCVLKGIFSGDGCVSDKEILISLRSKELIEGISTLLLGYGIISRISKNLSIPSKSSYLQEQREMFHSRLGSIKMLNIFRENINFLVNSKKDRLDKLCSRISTHDSSDVIPLSIEIKEELNEILGNNFNKHDYITRQNNIGRKQLGNLLELVPVGITNPIDSLRTIVKSDIFWDKVKSIEEVEYKDFVYDISVPNFENFICENIIAHNTLELPVESLKKLNYDIQRMKVRSSLLKTSNEVSADDGIRTSLRLGDSSLIIGEVRSLEAQALYEAMRVGALANVVAGTIHGSSPYSVFDRVVNDLKVPVTSFKATDLIMVANPIKTPDGLRSMKRVVQLSEVRKHWIKDPEEERGFVDLIKYNVEKDELEPTDELMNGDSEIIKAIASNIKGFAGDWEAVYGNILLRAKIKQEIVDFSDKLKMPILLESKFNHLSNNLFHEFSKDVQEEYGIPVPDKVFSLWQNWLKETARGKRF
jgi:type IV secretory pathway ATPase VirB11/archaellum biosynthesis ATPase/intein/homing endonuclease